MKKRILSICIIFLLLITVVSCKKNENPLNNSVVENNPEQLQFLKTDMKLTQEQVMSQIKAEYLKENNGYKDSDEIITLVTLPSKSLIDVYNEKYYNISNTLAEFAKTAKGKEILNSLDLEQEKLIEELKNKELIIDVEYKYSTVVNAIAVKTTYGNFKKISKLASVKSTILSDTYNLPKTTESTDASAIENIVDVYETGIFNSSSVDFTGEGTAVAVLDSGFDCSHSVFAIQPQTEMISQQDITKVLDSTRASAMNRGLELSDVYYSRKIPFVYDYADKDPDVCPFDSEHGTHVAGIIGGKDNTITGVAVNTQLVLLKVFPDLDDGAKTEDIVAALEDAVLLGVDAINMSLGSSCGFTREADEDAINAIYDKINESGISLLTAASNSYSASFGGEQGNTNFVTNPDSGTVGSPSTYHAALSVASISGTKSKYIVGNNSQVIFFKESSSINGDENDFFAELGITEGKEQTYEYVTIPGVGLSVNYATVEDLTGKIALIKRGTNTFEEKAMLAKNHGAVACIIYNNVDGDISMSMGKSGHIPTISISKDAGTILASKSTGTLKISFKNQAGPFMSDFSSWGPTPSLELKPEITAHGGNITSAIPGGGYDQLSGTSMATPNLCGIVVLIRQYLKEAYPDYSAKEISVLTNQLLMSTANIVLNEEGNPYSPRKQGAGLASLYNSVNTDAYITVDRTDRTKIELFDDPKRTGEYTMEFNVVNLSDKSVSYTLDLVGMTESVSTSDSKHVAEKSQILNGNTTYELISGGTLDGKKITIPAGETAKVKAIYKLTTKDKELIDSLFPYGMYVEGFIKLDATGNDGIDLNVPFLAFYGDWTEAPLFDKTYYEVESEAHDASIDDEDKLKADYWATTPYGSYYYNYIIPLGTYLYDVDTTAYDAIPANTDTIALSNVLGTIDGITSVYTGLLRNAKTMHYTITDKVTGEVVYDYIDYNAPKAYSNGGTPIPYFDNLKISSYKLGLVNNREYEFKMEGLLDYGDGGVSSNVRNTFEFDFHMDDEAPVLTDVQYEKVYDKTLKKDRYYITMTVYDNQYAQSITPIAFTSNSSYTFLTENPIPIYSEKGQENKVRFEITEFLENLYADDLITSALAFSIDDYALNSNIYLCQLPGTKGEFKFTEDGTMDSPEKLILSVTEGEIVDLTKYLATSDVTVDANKDYLKYLSWTSSNEKVAKVKEGMLTCLAPGRVTITVQEAMELKQAIIIVNIKENKDKTQTLALEESNLIEDATIKSIRFSYFETLFAYSRAAQTSEIGSTGSKIFLSSLSEVSFYPGEKIQLFHDLDPWYAEDKYELTYSSANDKIATVDENGVVTALKKGSTTITLRVGGSNLMAVVKVNVKSEFVIENRMLVAYKGLGGEVVIPDDEGILYISSFAFCLYETDHTVELPEDDFDANKIPSANTTITSVVIPEGVEEIQKYAFYNCSGLKSVILPKSLKIIREYAFYNDIKLESIDLSNVQTIGGNAFNGCESLKTVNLSKIYAIGKKAFEGCKSLKAVDLSTLRNTGEEAFKNCTGLEQVTLTQDTKLSYAMFVGCGIKNLDIYGTVHELDRQISIPTFCFAKCDQLEEVNLHNNFLAIGYGAFSDCTSLTEFNILGKLEIIEEQAFYNANKLETITLPNNEVVLGNYSFYMCNNLNEVKFQENTKIVDIQGSIFEDTNVSKFVVDNKNPYYAVDASNTLLLSDDELTIIFAAPSVEYGDYTLDQKYAVVGKGAFAGANITTLTITNKNLIIEDYAFVNCDTLEKIVFPSESGVEVKNHSFNYSANLKEIENLDKVLKVGDYAFANSGLTKISLGENAVFGEGVFFQSYLEEVTIGANSIFGLGSFQDCTHLVTVNMPEAGGVHFGQGCFGYDILLDKIDLTKTDNIIERETFYGCTSLKVANLTNVEHIGEYAFADCSALNYINMPKVITIGEGAFSMYDTEKGAPIFAEVILPETLTSIGEGAFIGCQGITEITIPTLVTEISDFTFAYCINLEEVKLSENITKIGTYSFAGCENLVAINLGNVEEVADYAFIEAKSLENVDISKVKTIGMGSFADTYLSGNHTLNELTSVGGYAFQNTLISSFVAPNLEAIGEAAFIGNKNLTEFTFSTSIKEIGSLAFNGCTGLTTFNYLEGNNKVTTGIINEYARLYDGILYTILESGNLELKSVPANKEIKNLEVVEGTHRIDVYAGNGNNHVTKIILPDSLKLIGNYAFYDYKNLETVEFRSFTAPALENWYNSASQLVPGDPGYEIIKNYFDLFGFELYYYTFIDLVGKKEPIKMILPSNPDIEGYDSIVYFVYFGKVEDATRSEYVAMHKNMIDFIKYAKEISELNVITLVHDKLINTALACYNSIKQNPVDFGYTLEEWNQMVKVVTDAKATLTALQFANASQIVHKLQDEINQLPTTFDLTKIELLKNITTRINALKVEEKALLDLTKYNELLASYNAYVQSVEQEAAPIITFVDTNLSYVVLATAVSMSIATFAVVIIRKFRFM